MAVKRGSQKGAPLWARHMRKSNLLHQYKNTSALEWELSQSSAAHLHLRGVHQQFDCKAPLVALKLKLLSSHGQRMLFEGAHRASRGQGVGAMAKRIVHLLDGSLSQPFVLLGSNER